MSIGLFISHRQDEPGAAKTYNACRRWFLRNPGPRSRGDDPIRFLPYDEAEGEFLRASNRLTRKWLTRYVSTRDETEVRRSHNVCVHSPNIVSVP